MINRIKSGGKIVHDQQGDLLSVQFHENIIRDSNKNRIKNHAQLFSTFLDERQCKICKRKQAKLLLIQFRLFIFYKPACL